MTLTLRCAGLAYSEMQNNVIKKTTFETEVKYSTFVYQTYIMHMTCHKKINHPLKKFQLSCRSLNPLTWKNLNP